MKLGLMLMTQDPPRAGRIVERWQQLLELARVAEESGFDGVFVPEHHMADDACLPSPLVALAAIAARTSRIELGTAALVLPFHHPVSVAEDAAVLDVISSGRVRLGCGLGRHDIGAAMFGVQREEQLARLEEGIDIIRRAWAGEAFDHAGEHFRAVGRIAPLPVGAELWLAAMSASGVRRAARLGLPWLSDPIHNNAVVGHWARAYREAGDEHGTKDALKLVMIRDAWVEDSLIEVERTWWPHTRDDLVGRAGFYRNLPRAVAERDPVLAAAMEVGEFDFHRHRAERFIVGSPTDCIEQIREFDKTVGGIDYLVCRMRMPTGPAFDAEVECVQRFGREVAPAVR